jgi:predicted GNAT family acetyltransferase
MPCGDLLAEGKVCCLTYHNPEAGHVYTRLGFTVASPWIHCTV